MSKLRNQPQRIEQEALYGIDWRVVRSLGLVILVFSVGTVVGPAWFSTQRRTPDIEITQVDAQWAPAKTRVDPAVTPESPVVVSELTSPPVPIAESEGINAIPLSAQLTAAEEDATIETQRDTVTSVAVVESSPIASQLAETASSAESEITDEVSESVPSDDVSPHEDSIASAFSYSRQRAPLSEDGLLVDLQSRVKDVDLNAVKGSSGQLLKSDRGALSKPESLAAVSERFQELVSKRPDLIGLPFRKGKDCQSDRKTAQAAGRISRDFQLARSRSLTSRRPSQSDGSSFSEQNVGGHWLRYMSFHTAGQQEKNVERIIPTLVQMLQVEPAYVRYDLVVRIAAVKHPIASVVLAQRAMFDLSSDVRRASLQELKTRPAREYRQQLLNGLRYPWPPVADHAAEALVAVAHVDAVSDLKSLLAKPDPQAPFQNEKRKWVVRELVRVNHLRNCLLCHAPSRSRKDLVRGFVPVPGSPIPVAYYRSQKGHFVRADVTYLKQDFSLMHSVEKHGVWPRQQRFDYLVRTRELSPKEVEDLNVAKPAESSTIHKQRLVKAAPASYPQREAVSWALTKLTSDRLRDSFHD